MPTTLQVSFDLLDSSLCDQTLEKPHNDLGHVLFGFNLAGRLFHNLSERSFLEFFDQVEQVEFSACLKETLFLHVSNAERMCPDLSLLSLAFPLASAAFGFRNVLGQFLLVLGQDSRVLLGDAVQKFLAGFLKVSVMYVLDYSLKRAADQLTDVWRHWDAII